MQTTVWDTVSCEAVWGGQGVMTEQIPLTYRPAAQFQGHSLKLHQQPDTIKEGPVGHKS